MTANDNTPAHWGLPEKFSTWRESQADGTDKLIFAESRFTGLCMPTGIGKSLVYIAAAVIAGLRVCVLTGQKILQDQLESDFGGIGLVTVKGRNNYNCGFLRPRFGREGESTPRTCEDGAYAGCPMRRDGTCPAVAARRAAESAQLVSANYSLWMSVNEFSDGLGDFDLLVLDEAHLAPDLVIAHMSTRWADTDTAMLCEVLGRGDISTPHDRSVARWHSWGEQYYSQLARVHDNCVEELSNKAGNTKLAALHRKTSTLIRKVQRILQSTAADWVIEQIKPYRGEPYWSICPVWVHDVTEQILFCGVPQVAMVAATLVTKTCDLLGVPGGDLELWEYDTPSDWEWERGAVYHIETTRMSYRMSEADLGIATATWADLVELHEKSGPRRGIVQAVSYQRRQYIINEVSALLGKQSPTQFDTHTNSRDLMERLEDFWQSPPPRVFVSPSITTGLDFEGDRAEWQLIPKVPFPDMRSIVQRARSEDDPHYANYAAVQTIIQMVGRLRRKRLDRGVSYITDDNVGWLMYRYRTDADDPDMRFVPQYFRYKKIWADKPLPEIPPSLAQESVSKRV